MITRKDFKDYERIKCIGKGAFGTAVLYKRLTDNNDVVIKEIFLSDMTDSEKHMAFNEANVLASLNHSNIIRYLGSFEKEGSLFIEMEYADNGNLAQLINLRKQKNKMFKEIDVIEIMTQISSAIAYMHSNKVLHRDLKTANIFLNKSGILKIGDFGISKMLTTRIQAQTVVGTPYYLSPEMCEGKDYDEKSDVWAIGCILYELTCFRKPFEALNLPSLVQKISMCEYDDIPDTYSQNLSDLLKNILQKDYSKRPSASEIHDNFLPQIRDIFTSDQISTQFENRSAAGDGFSIFLNVNGLLYTCGEGKKGCLGQNSWNNVLRPTIIDSLIATCITQVKCGNNHVLALSADNQLYSWGSSSYGQLGLGHEKFCNVPVQVQLSKEIIIQSIFAGYFSSALVDVNGNMLVCGDNAYGKLGAQEEKELYFKKNLIKEKVAIVSIGEDHCMIITRQKKIIGIGNNKKGQFGMGNCKLYNSPQNTQLSLNVTMISCGASYTAVGTGSNAIYIWGKLIKSATSSKYLETEAYFKPEREVTEIIKKPKCILALYASKERLKAGHKIWLSDVAVVKSTLFIVVHTTAPPPFKQLHTGHNNNNTHTNIPDWMDTNIELMQTTLPNTPQFT